MYLISIKNFERKIFNKMDKIMQRVALHFQNNKNCFVFAVNDNYAPYLSVALYSFIANSDSNELYDICILHTDLSDLNIEKLENMKNANCNIRCINISSFLNSIDSSIFVTHAHFSKEAYYRFFIPKIFINYKKVIYYDCDLIFLENMQNILQIDLLNKPMAAVLEYKFKCKVQYDSILNNYAHNILKLSNVQNYFNSGFLVFDIVKLHDMNFTEKCITRLLEVQRPRTVDQCIINSVLQDNVLFLDACYNLQTHVEISELKQYVSLQDYTCYMEGLLKPKVVHYCSPIKPWNSSDTPLAKVWWKYATQENLNLVR